MRAPDLSSALVKAWKIDPTNLTNARAGIETWLINGPYHPYWDWWYMTCISLKDLPGLPPAYKSYPTAEYEFMILSMNPDYPVDIDSLEAGHGGVKTLSPPDVVIQFGGIAEEDAAALVTNAAMAIVGGQSCDSDFRTWWVTAILRGADHLRTGGHHNMEGRA